MEGEKESRQLQVASNNSRRKQKTRKLQQRHGLNCSTMESSTSILHGNAGVSYAHQGVWLCRGDVD